MPVAMAILKWAEKHGHTTATHYTAIAADLLVGIFPTNLTQYFGGLLGW